MLEKIFTLEYYLYGREFRAFRHDLPCEYINCLLQQTIKFVQEYSNSKEVLRIFEIAWYMIVQHIKYRQNDNIIFDLNTLVTEINRNVATEILQEENQEKAMMKLRDKLIEVSQKYQKDDDVKTQYTNLVAKYENNIKLTNRLVKLATEFLPTIGIDINAIKHLRQSDLIDIARLINPCRIINKPIYCCHIN